MFKKNDQHLQQPLFSSLNSLPPKQRTRLRESWAGTFYKEVFCRLPEETLAILYSDQPSRPNIPVNVLMGLEILKAGFGWSDEEMYDNFCYNMQVRYALGYRDLGEGHFELRSVYNFRKRHTDYMEATGENLFEVCFEAVTAEQLAKFEIESGIQRVDSKQIANNIRQMGRLQLLVEVVQRVYRMLQAADKLKYEATFEPYLKGKSGHYINRVKKEEQPAKIEQVGQVMAYLVEELRDRYAVDETYQILERVLGEHFEVGEAGGVQSKATWPGSTLQSPDDVDATYRRKGGKGQAGYVASVTETADPENPFQLITKAQTEPNLISDAAMLQEAIPDLVARTGLETIYNDGTYTSAAVDEVCRDHHIKQIPTGIRGEAPSGAQLGLADFDFTCDQAGLPLSVTCPDQQQVEVTPGKSDHRFVVLFDQTLCASCPQVERCPTIPNKTRPKQALYFSLAELGTALRRQAMQHAKASGRNLRAAVEATVREVTCRFQARVPYRGHHRVSVYLVAAALMTNARRIWRYQHEQETAMAPQDRVFLGLMSLIYRLVSALSGFLKPFSPEWAEWASA